MLIGSCALSLAWKVLLSESASVSFEQYLPVLEAAREFLPPDREIFFLADQGFGHEELVRWLSSQGWRWRIRLCGRHAPLRMGGKAMIAYDLFRTLV